jgi:peptidyl-prolyl cis-trans isomerase D
MRKQARSWFVKILLGAIIVVFVLYFGSMSGGRGGEAIATVNGKPITHAEFQTEYRNMLDMLRQYYQGALNDDMLKQLNLKQQAFDKILNRAVINEMAGRLHLSVTDGEIRQAIASYPAFQKDGAFSQEYYQRILKQNKLSAEDFEAMQRNGIMAEKLRKVITEGAVVSDLEAKDFYRLQNEKINLQFVKLSPESFHKRVKFSDSDLEKHLKDNSESFRVQEKIQVQYIIFSASDLAGSAEITEDEINNFYSLYGKKFAKAGKVPPLSEIKGKIVSEIRSYRGMDAASREAKKAYETIYQENNFEEYAKKGNLRVYSTDVFSKDSIPAEIRELKDINSLFTLKKDEITAPVPSEKGYHLFRLVSQKPSYVPSLNEAKRSVENSYINAEAAKLAGTEAERILAELKKGADLTKISTENGLKISETGMFIAGSPRIPNIGDSRDISLSLSQLSEKNPYPAKVFAVNGVPVIVKFKDRQLADEKGFNKEALKSALTRAKENSIYEAWLNQAKEDLGKSGKLKIIKDVKDL